MEQGPFIPGTEHPACVPYCLVWCLVNGAGTIYSRDRAPCCCWCNILFSLEPGISLVYRAGTEPPAGATYCLVLCLVMVQGPFIPRTEHPAGAPYCLGFCLVHGAGTIYSRDRASCWRAILFSLVPGVWSRDHLYQVDRKKANTVYQYIYPKVRR